MISWRNTQSPLFHPEGKYISVVKDGKNIEIINLKNGVVEQDIVDPTGGVTGGRFFKEQPEQRGISADQSYETNGLLGTKTDSTRSMVRLWVGKWMPR